MAVCGVLLQSERRQWNHHLQTGEGGKSDHGRFRLRGELPPLIVSTDNQ